MQKKIAIKKMGPNRQNPKLIEVNGKSYYFSPQNNICLAYVDEEDVAYVLNIKKSCCNGKAKPYFFLASQDDIRRYKNGGR